MKQYDAYLFDLYGTLVDIHTDESKPAFWQAVAEAYSRRGAPYTGPELHRAYLRLCAAEEEKLRAAAPAGTLVEPDLEAVFRALYLEKEMVADASEIAETAAFFRRRSTTRLRAYAGAKPLLEALRRRGSPVILLSNAQSCFTVPELRQLGLADSFDRIYISSDAGVKKPDAGFFRLPIRDLGLQPSRCLMIGNDPDCDIRGAVQAGLDAFYLRSALTPHTAPLPETLPVVGYLPTMDLRQLQRRLLGRNLQID